MTGTVCIEQRLGRTSGTSQDNGLIAHVKWIAFNFSPVFIWIFYLHFSLNQRPSIINASTELCPMLEKYYSFCTTGAICRRLRTLAQR